MMKLLDRYAASHSSHHAPTSSTSIVLLTFLSIFWIIDSRAFATCQVPIPSLLIYLVYLCFWSDNNISFVSSANSFTCLDVGYDEANPTSSPSSSHVLRVPNFPATSNPLAPSLKPYFFSFTSFLIITLVRICERGKGFSWVCDWMRPVGDCSRPPSMPFYLFSLSNFTLQWHQRLGHPSIHKLH